MSTLDRLVAERDEARDAAIAMAEADDFDPKNPDFLDLQSRAEALDLRIDALATALEARANARTVGSQVSRGVQRRSASSDDAIESFGEQFVGSEQFRNYPSRGTMQALQLEGFLETRAALGTGDFQTMAGPTTRFKDDRPVRTPALDSVTRIPVTTNSIDVVQIVMTENNADVVAEGTAKPESTFVEVVTPFVLDTIAHWTQMTRQLIEDSGAVRAAVERKLRRGVLLKANAEAAAAIAGGTYSTVVNADLMAAIRLAVGELQDAGLSPDTVYLNPADWAALDIASQGDGSSGTLRSQYWNLDVVPLSAQAAGSALVADAGEAFENYYRSGVSTYITDSHASTFTSNIFTLLAEGRGKTVVADASAVRETAAA